MTDARQYSTATNHNPGAPDLLRETLLTLSQAARRLPAVRKARSPHTDEKPPHPSTLFRWARKGLKSRSGRIVHLTILPVGGTYCTSLEALARFFGELQDSGPIDLPIPSALPDAALRKQADNAKKILRERGLLE